ncbi:hypothetical protein ABIF38_005800 [Bradyrhizobium japonicum]|nr:hypothetical protein [Bradyrhizobium elkanii]MCP1731892.1 hypothetical protein [Bradyrhizobium elkanii]MCS3567226.1 hypothetical protein [Bradyrhizobium elkanii]MCS3591288.1 hypothetical protein [Bradyrhizobium elkanii]MCS3620732.1 hypothetical protein [Bradyrhizobium elkanii]MCW2111096.1 hypothetical protein [Bradyrhizobium elkanii]
MKRLFGILTRSPQLPASITIFAMLLAAMLVKFNKAGWTISALLCVLQIARGGTGERG